MPSINKIRYGGIDYDILGEELADLEEETTALKEDYANIIDSAYVTDTASGSIASFPDGSDNMPVKSLTVNIEPVQDLHGQANPYPAGGGKNQFYVNESIAFPVTQSGITFNVVDSVVTLNGTASSEIGVNALEATLESNTTYTVSASGINADSRVVLQGYKSGSFVGSIGALTSSTTSMTVASSDTYDMVRARPTALNGKTLSNVKLYIQLEKGSTATAWGPYENICPISGHTQAVVTRCGKNLFNKSNTANILNNADMSDATISSSSQRCVVFIPCNPNRTYTASRKAVLTNERFAIGYTAELPAVGVAIKNTTLAPKAQTIGNLMSLSVTTGSDAKYLIVWAYWDNKTEALDDLQIELDSTATAYEPYNGQTVTIDFGQTVYGGTLDVLSGVLTVDREYRLLNGVNGDEVTYNSNGHTANTTRAFIRISDKAYGTNNMISSSFFYQASGDVVGMMNGRAAGDGIEFYLDPSVSNTEEGVKAWFAENPTDLVYELAEPLTVQLTANEVSTLLGQNNIWSDAGDVEVEYRADTKLYIEKLTAPTEDDMIADHAISANTFFMVGNTLYRATTAIASGATITVGTNATKLSLSDALNALS